MHIQYFFLLIASALITPTFSVSIPTNTGVKLTINNPDEHLFLGCDATVKTGWTLAPAYDNTSCLPFVPSVPNLDFVSFQMAMSKLLLGEAQNPAWKAGNHASGINVFSDNKCVHTVAMIVPPGGLRPEDPFCASQHDNGGAWASIQYLAAL